MEIIQDYVVLIVLLTCFCVGYIIKKVIPNGALNKYIPLIMGLLGIILNTWINNWNFTPQVLLGGLASGLASTGSYELFKNFKNKGE